MQVAELVQLAQFLNTFIRERALVAQYDKLVNAVNQASQNQNPENVLKILDRIAAIHSDASSAVLSVAQQKLLSEFGGDPVLGTTAATRLREIVAANSAHPQGMVQAIEQLKSETTTLATRANNLVAAMGPMLAVVKAEEPEAEEGRLWLYFSEKTQVFTVADLEKAAKTWDDILGHFARLPGASSGGRILAISKNSPLEIELAASLKLLVPLAFGITFLLNKLEHVINIGIKAEELKQMKVKTKIVQDLQAEAEAERKKIAEAAAQSVIEAHGGDGEAKTAIALGLKSILRFIEGGGQLDIDVPSTEGEEAPNPESEKGAMRALVEKIRRDIRYLPSGPAAEGDADSPPKS